MHKLSFAVGLWLAMSAVVVAQQEIHRAAQRGDLTRVKQLLDRNPQLLEATDRRGQTPLFYAVSAVPVRNPIQRLFQGESPQMLVLRELLRRKANANHRDRFGRTPLWLAIQRRNLPAMQALVQAGASLNNLDRSGNNALMVALMFGNEPAALYFLKRVDPNARNASGQTALHLAASRGMVSAVRALIQAGAKVNLPDRNGSYPVHFAVHHPEVLKVLLEAGADPNVSRNGWTPLVSACQSLNAESVKLLLEAGAKAEWPVQNRTPLSWALQSISPWSTSRKPEKVVALLLEAGADPNRKGPDGKTPLELALQTGYAPVIDLIAGKVGRLPERSPEGEPILFWAAREGMTNVAQLALKQGIAADQTDDQGRTPLYLAIQHGHLDVARVLLQAGADVNRRFEGGVTLLHLAAAARKPSNGSGSSFPGRPIGILPRRRPVPGGPAPSPSRTPGPATPEDDALSAQLVQLLVKRGADPSVADQSGSTPLHVAAWEGKPRTARALLEAGATVNFPAGQSSPLHKAAWVGHAETVELLLKAGAEPNARDADGQTPLHKAAFRGHAEVVKALLRANADPTQKDSAGMTPRDLAQDRKHEAVVRLLAGT